MIDPDEALRRTLDLAARPTSEFVTLDDALGRFLGADIHTPWDLPAHDNSAMDGYAIRAADTADATGVHPVRLTIVGSVFAGTRPTAIVGPGQAVRIMTGAVIPAGADTVVRQEATRAGEGVVDVRIASDRGNNVRLRGETLRRDELVLRVGTKVTSQEIALLAAFGRCQVPVARRPTVHVVTCGDELHDAHEAADDLTVDSNGPMIAAMAREAGAIAYRSGPVKDDLEQLRAHLLQVLSTVDVLITIGGASVGERDLVVDALRAHGAELVFHTVALKPGKPVGLFILREKPVFVLPGNPAACSMTFDRLVRPFLLAVQGVPREQVSRPRLPAILANDVHKQPGLTYYLRGWAELALGGLQVRLPPRQSSGQLTAGLEGNAVAIIPAGPGTVFAGTPVEIELLKPPHVAPRPPILAFAGYSGSGKTTALTALISRLSARGVRVAALKHDAHEFQLDREGKDTAKFSAAGATAVGIASASRRAVIATTSRATTLAELIATITVEVDVILGGTALFFAIRERAAQFHRLLPARFAAMMGFIMTPEKPGKGPRVGVTLALQRRKHRRQFRGPPSRRAFLIGGAAMVAAGASMVGLVARTASPRLEGLSLPVRPPTASPDDDAFRRACIRCGLCGTVCENGCIRFFGADEPEMGAMTPYLDVRRRSCTLCMRCTNICPSGALRPVADDLQVIAEKIDMGRAKVERDLCLSYLGRICGYCHDVCPLPGKAIKLTTHGLPVIQDGCVGCGRCVEHCPQNPSALTLVPASAWQVPS